MTTKETPSDLRARVLARIQEGGVHVRSRKYFYTRLALMTLVSIAVLVISALIFNFILFTMLAEHRAPLLNDGPAGYLVFLELFPWLLLIADIVLLVLLRQLLNSFEFGYKKPTLYTLSILLVAIGALGGLLYKESSFNERVERRAHEGHLPKSVGSFFDDAHSPPPPIYGHQMH